MCNGEVSSHEEVFWKKEKTGYMRKRREGWFRPTAGERFLSVEKGSSIETTFTKKIKEEFHRRSIA